MASQYKLGTTYVGMQTLDALGLPDPFPASFIHATEVYADGVGQPQADGFARAVWRFDILSVTQWGTLLDYFSGQSAEVYIRTRRDVAPLGSYASQFEVFTGFMVRPDVDSYELEMGYWYRNIEIYFEALEAYSP